MMKQKKKIRSSILMFLLAVVMIKGVIADAATFNDINASTMFFKQNTTSTCTLSSAAMMVRRAALLNGNGNWADVTERNLRSTAWLSGVGLYNSFSYAGIYVTSAKISSNKTQTMINLLSQHPEGIVIYDYGKPHAILLTDYTDGIFYCADPSSAAPGGRIPISRATITLESMDKYWYVSRPKLSVTSADTNIPSNIYISDAISYPTGNLSLGQSYPVGGTIYSSNPLTNVTGTIYNSANAAVQQKSVNPNATSYNLRGPINNAMIFNNLSAGSYRFVVSASDNKGYSKNVIESNFTVGTIPAPSIASSDVAGGVKISMSASQGTIHYTLDGSEPTTASPVYTGEFPLHNSAVIKAFAEQNGSRSSVVTQSVTVRKLATPEITITMEEDSVAVSIGSDAGAAIYYTTDGSTPNESSERYLQPLHIKEAKKIRAIAVKNGSVNSDIAEKEIKAEAPGTPSASLSGADKIAVGEAAKVVWDRQEYAQSYLVKLYKDEKVMEETTIQGCAYAFTLLEAGEYQITISALNFIGSSAESYPPVKVTAMEPLTVTFADADGSVISSQKVRYGYTAELPENPSRRGYEFKKWSNSAVYAAIKEDLLVKAEYSKRKYIVKFLDAEGNVYAPQQEVLFDESVVLPKEPETDQIGYAFMDWRCISSDEDSALDYKHVDANMTLQAVFDWGNRDLPIVSSITKALQVDSNSYKVSVSLTNWPEGKTYCKLLVSLKTSNGKMVKTITKDITLEAGKTTSIEDIELISDKVATQVEVNVVGLEGQKTAGAYAKTASAKTTSYVNTVWSDWSPNMPPAGTVTENKTVYRCRSKMYTDSSSSSLNGWTQSGSTTIFGDWSGTCSTNSYPGENLTRQIVGTSTVYNYYHVCCNYYGGKNNVDSIEYGTGSHRHHKLTTSSPLRTFAMADKGGKQCYGGKGAASGCPNNYYAWFLDGTTTTYYYQDRSVTNVYHFWRWGDWGNYVDEPISITDEQQVEVSTFYRYQIPMETPADQEDTTGNTYTEEGNLSGTELDLNGKCANILVYRSTNSDPTESQLEYVGQTVIGENNSYSFSFIPKEEPEEAKSNYIVALAIEGQTSLYNIDVIYAEKVRYKVRFYDRSGNEISNCEVKSGENAVVPEVPEVPGYTFIGWDKDTTNILSDKFITAKYKENEYSVVYVDFESNTVDLLQLAYGTALPSPAVEAAEGQKFLGWDKILDGIKTVDGNMILTARYEKKKYTVIFADDKDKVIDKQEVVYGESAALPEDAFTEDAAFLGWSTDNSWWKVKNDMIVKPIFGYAKTADTPLYHIEDIYHGGILTISQTKGQDVYYSIEWASDELVSEEQTETTEEDGIGQVEEEAPVWQLYEEEIILDRDANIHFYATGDQMNASNVVDIAYQCNEKDNPYLQTAKLQLGDAKAQKGMAVNIPISLQTNPGLQGMRFSVDYDTSVFSDVTFLGTGSESIGTIEYQVDKENGRIEIFWNNNGEEKKTGKLGTLVLQAKETIADGMYPLKCQYTQEDTYDGNWMDVKLDVSGGNIQVGNGSSTGVEKPDDSSSGKPGSSTEKPGSSTVQKPAQKPSGGSTGSNTIKKPSVAKVKSFKAKAGKKKLSLSWKKVSGAAGYQIQVSQKSSFKKAKTISISKSKKSYTKKGLKARKVYYARIRAYKTYKDTSGKTQKVYGKWVKISKKTK